MKVPFLPGDGTEVEVEVAYLASFPCNQEGECAFCLGDPCAEEGKDKDTLIAAFWRRNPKAETCPMCDGRPS